MVSFAPWPLYSHGKSPWYPLDRRLGGPQNRTGLRRMETTEICFLRASTGYRMTDHKLNEDIREELGITGIIISTVRKSLSKRRVITFVTDAEKVEP
jgi:hypothetical protein